MKYFVYFDGYGHVKALVDEKELKKDYQGDPQWFLKAMSAGSADAGKEEATGHVGTLTFDSEQELKEYLATCTDVVTGFFECASDSRPYNF